MVDVHARMIQQLEQVAGLDRELEFLPDDETIAERKGAHAGLVAPELAVVMAYCKIQLYAELLESDLPEDPYLAHDLERYFPPPLPERYSDRMPSHRLRREIIATVVANQLVDRAGTTFAFRLREETGAPPSMLARAYAVAREVFEMRAFWAAVEALDNEVDADGQLDDADRGPAAGRARHPLAGARQPADDRHRGGDRTFGPGAQGAARARSRTCSRATTRTPFDDRAEELRDGRRARRARHAAWRRCRRCSRCSTSSRSPPRRAATRRR